MNVCDIDIETLEAFEAGALPPPRLAELTDHLTSCDACGAELEMLRQEQRLMALRAASQPATDHLWRGIEERLRKPPRRAQPATLPLAISTALAAAAVLAMLVWGPRPGLPGPDPTRVQPSVKPALPEKGHDAPTAAALLEIDRAEREYAVAAAALERRFAAERGRLRSDDAHLYDEALPSRPPAASVDRDNVEARQVVLAGYANYFHSLQRLVVNLEVNR